MQSISEMLNEAGGLVTKATNSLRHPVSSLLVRSVCCLLAEACNNRD